MNRIEKLFFESKEFIDFALKYFQYLTELLGTIDRKVLNDFITEIEEARENGKCIYIIGNGGSAATASHMANDLGMDVLKKSGIIKPIKVFSLTDNMSLITAIGNDDGYENVFINQLRINYNDGDKLIAISASGNSPNVVNAAKWVKKKGGTVIGLVGFDGGKLKDICDIIIHVVTQTGEYGPVEDIHMIIDHVVANWLHYKLKKDDEFKYGKVS